jgi:plasmid stability protein
MAKVLIRDLDDRTIAALKKHAAQNRRSLQAELQLIVERAAAANLLDSRSVATRIRRKLSGRGHSDSAALIAEDRRR